MSLELSGWSALLFALFAALTAALAAVLTPIYDNLFVPEMAPGQVYAPLTGAGGGLFPAASRLSSFLLVSLVDPFSVLVLVILGGLYLLRASLPERFARFEALAPRAVIGILLSNFVLPLAQVLWNLAAAVYPVLSTYEGGAWEHFSNIVPEGGLAFSWGNGALAFVLTLGMFILVLGLAFVVALRDALVATLLVLLPPLTLIWVLPPLASYAQQVWKLFAEMVFLPSLLLVPLLLSVGAPSILLVYALFTIAVGMPHLISRAGASLVGSGFLTAGGWGGGELSGGVRGLRSEGRRGGAAAAGGLLQGIRAPSSTSFSASSGPPRLGPTPILSASSLAWRAGQGLGHLGRRLWERSGSGGGTGGSLRRMPRALPSRDRLPPRS
jgi:hypothetical protein